MPKAPRVNKVQGKYRSSPITIAPTTSQSFQLPNPESPGRAMQTSHQYQRMPMDGMNGGPVQPLHYPPPPVQAPAQVMPPSTSTAWTPQNDEILLNARARGMNWQPIQQQYFPNKTANACRKRHERLITAKSNTEDWETTKMKELAEAYMGMREKIWKQLADQVGEKWNVVEARCMSSGLKNLQSLARAHHRDQRDQPVMQPLPVSHVPSHAGHHTLHTPGLSYNTPNRNSIGSFNGGDDSAISGVGSYDTDAYSPNGGDYNRSSGEFAPNDQMVRSDEPWSVHRMQERGNNLMHPQQQPQPSYGRIEQRHYSLSSVPSTDMRIPNLINAPVGGLNGMNSHDSGMSRRGHESGSGMSNSMNNGMSNGMNGHHNNGRN